MKVAFIIVKKTIKCDHCERKFLCKGDLNKHNSIVHEEKKLFKCELCNSCFFEKSNLIRHIEAVHEKRKPFNCELCDLRFSSAGIVKTHIAAIHEGMKPLKSKCIVCDKFFFNKSSMVKHFKSQHGNS